MLTILKNPIRIVVSTIGTRNYEISNYLVKTIQPVLNSFELISKVNLKYQYVKIMLIHKYQLKYIY